LAKKNVQVRRPAGKELRPPRRILNPIERSLAIGLQGGSHMKLNHLNLTVSNVPEAHHFLEKHFGLKGYGGREPGEAMSFLSDDNGMVLALFRAAKGTEAKYPAGFHIGFIQESAERVNEINQRLLDDGYDVAKPARLHGSWTFYFKAPGGFTVEVLA
jgi:lactoylglutathione lyase